MLMRGSASHAKLKQGNPIQMAVKATATGNCVTRNFTFTHVHCNAPCTQFWHLQHLDNKAIVLRCTCLDLI
jgi:hypothetical protein